MNKGSKAGKGTSGLTKDEAALIQSSLPADKPLTERQKWILMGMAKQKQADEEALVEKDNHFVLKEGEIISLQSQIEESHRLFMGMKASHDDQAKKVIEKDKDIEVFEEQTKVWIAKINEQEEELLLKTEHIDKQFSDMVERDKEIDKQNILIRQLGNSLEIAKDEIASLKSHKSWAYIDKNNEIEKLKEEINELRASVEMWKLENEVSLEKIKMARQELMKDVEMHEMLKGGAIDVLEGTILIEGQHWQSLKKRHGVV